MKHRSQPCVGITMGDPAGIGPEVIAKALRQPGINRLARFLVIGDAKVFRHYGYTLPPNIEFLDLGIMDDVPIPSGKIHPLCGKAAMAYLDVALALLQSQSLDALVTAPLCKEAVQLTQPQFQGHTEYLAKFFHVKNFDMMFVLDNLKLVLVTRHIPLKDVASRLSRQLIRKTISLTLTSLRNDFRIHKPRIAVCGLNPHAGEGGHIGEEELRMIAPVIKEMKRVQATVQGPFAADTLFYQGNACRYDAIIAMYHDQGLTALKTVHFYKLVNYTIGLPVIRTSPAHGTAFDIAGKNQADPSSMRESIRLAAHLAK